MIRMWSCRLKANGSRVSKDGSYHFEEERAAPLYVCIDDEPNLDGPRGLYVSDQRPWWFQIRVRPGTPPAMAYQRWMTVLTWLARAVPVIEAAIPNLPSGPILWRTTFRGEVGEFDAEDAARDFAEARAGMSTNADRAGHVIDLVVDQAFELAIFNVANDAERALVDAFVDGAALLGAEVLSTDAKAAIVNEVTHGTLARHSHAFRSADFRRRVQGQDLARPPR